MVVGHDAPDEVGVGRVQSGQELVKLRPEGGGHGLEDLGAGVLTLLLLLDNLEMRCVQNVQNIFLGQICKNFGKRLNCLSIHLLRLARVISEEIDDQRVVALFHLVDNLDDRNITRLPIEQKVFIRTVSLH